MLEPLLCVTVLAYCGHGADKVSFPTLFAYQLNCLGSIYIYIYMTLYFFNLLHPNTQKAHQRTFTRSLFEQRQLSQSHCTTQDGPQAV